MKYERNCRANDGVNKNEAIYGNEISNKCSCRSKKSKEGLKLALVSFDENNGRNALCQHIGKLEQIREDLDYSKSQAIDCKFA